MWSFKRKRPDKPLGAARIDVVYGVPVKTFTGNCMVFQHTADGHCVGRCYHSTYNGVCPLHGDVSRWLRFDPNWPNDYEV